MEQKRLCYISRNYYNLTSAGNKAKTDNEDTLAEMGAINLGLPRSIRNSKILAFFLDLIGIMRACILLQKDDVLFLQYPVKKYFSFLCHVAHLKGARTVSLIHDLGSFRRKKLTIQKEINRSKTLNHWQLLVCGNKEGLQGLQNNPQITYQGFVPSEEFIKHIDADFGLVWDGDSLAGCSGEYGQYLKWNSPHKVSFYLRAGLPLIIWKEAAVAPIIEEAGAGITIGSLEELDDKLANLTSEEKKEMKKQAVNLAQKLNKGGFLRDSFRSI